MSQPESWGSFQLNSGYKMPLLGLGTWTVFNNPPGEIEAATKAALECGYRHIDTATIYETEPLIGKAFVELAASGSPIKREDVFITGKVWCTDHSREVVFAAIEQTLKDLGTNYLDLYLIHWPMAYPRGKGFFPKDNEGFLIAEDIDYLETWKALEDLVDQGKVRSIGLSNFNIEQMQRVWDNARIKPATNQVELHIYNQNRDVARFCAEHGMAVTAYAPLAAPGRTWAKSDEPVLIEDPVVVAIATKLNRTPAQVAIRYLLQKGYVVIPKSTNPARIRENTQVFDFSIASSDMTALDNLNKDLRFYLESAARKHPDYPFKDYPFKSS